MPFSDQMHRAPEYLAARFPAGIFARGWIYEVTSHRVVARAPGSIGWTVTALALAEGEFALAQKSQEFHGQVAVGQKRCGAFRGTPYLVL